MTRLDLVLVATIALVAFALGAGLGPAVALAWKRPFAPAATHEVRQRVPQYREALATLERRRAKLRDRIAQEHVVLLVPRQGEQARTPHAHRRTLRTLYAVKADLTRQLGPARVALANAERRAQRAAARHRAWRQWEDRLGGALVAVAAVGVQIILLAVVSRTVGTPVAVGTVATGSLLVLAAILFGEAFGWIAAIALIVATTTLLVGRRTA